MEPSVCNTCGWGECACIKRKGRKPLPEELKKYNPKSLTPEEQKACREANRRHYKRNIESERTRKRDYYHEKQAQHEQSFSSELPPSPTLPKS